MKCPMCGLEFNPEEARSACAGCPLGRGCHFVRCPNCGYEIPQDTGLVKLLKSWSKKHGTGRKS